MDLADTLRVGDIIALSGSLVSFIASYARSQVVAAQAHEQLSELKVRVNEMSQELRSTSLRVAINSEKTDNHERKIEDVERSQVLMATRILDKLEILQKGLARVEGKLALADNR